MPDHGLPRTIDRGPQTTDHGPLTTNQPWPSRFAAGAPAFRPPRPLLNAHLQSILPSLFRRVRNTDYRRERIETPDGDFLDLDRLDAPGSPSSRAAVITHGLEGDAGRPYVRGMARALARRGWDVVAWNLRGCSG